MKIISKIVLTCEQATKFVERNHEGDLRRKERIQLAMHLFICNACRAYNKESKQINSLLDRYFSPPLRQEKPKDTENLKKRILTKLKK